MDIKRQKFMVFGVSKSGVAAVKLLLKAGLPAVFTNSFLLRKSKNRRKSWIALGARRRGRKSGWRRWIG